MSERYPKKFACPACDTTCEMADVIHALLGRVAMLEARTAHHDDLRAVSHAARDGNLRSLEDELDLEENTEKEVEK